MLVHDLMTEVECHYLQAELYQVGMGCAPDILDGIRYDLSDEEAVVACVGSEDLWQFVGDSADMHLYGDSLAAWLLMDWDERMSTLKEVFKPGESWV